MKKIQVTRLGKATTRCYYSKAEKRELIAGYRRSGQTMLSFCRTHEIGVSTLSSWLSSTALVDPLIPVELEPDDAKQSSPEDASAGQGVCRVFLPNGISIDYSSQVSAETLRALSQI